MIFPWPPKHEREAAIAEAARGKERAQVAAARAHVVEDQIKRMAAENHFATAIVRSIRGDQ